MRRDYALALILAVVGLSGGVVSMVGPEYLRLTGPAAARTFWIGMIVMAVFAITAVVVAKPPKVGSELRGFRMLAVIGMVVSAMAFVASAAAYFWPISAGKGVTASIQALNIISPKGNEVGHVDIIVAVQVENPQDEPVVIDDWRLVIHPPSAQPREITAIPLLEQKVFFATSGVPLFVFDPNVSLVGRTDYVYRRGKVNGRIWFPDDDLRAVQVSDVLTKFTLSGAIGGQRVEFDSKFVRDLGPRRE